MQHPPRVLQRLRIGFEPMPAAQIVERQSLALSFFDLTPYPCQPAWSFSWSSRGLIIGSSPPAFLFDEEANRWGRLAHGTIL
jgi:hypothetical protein